MTSFLKPSGKSFYFLFVFFLFVFGCRKVDTHTLSPQEKEAKFFKGSTTTNAIVKKVVEAIKSSNDQNYYLDRLIATSG